MFWPWMSCRLARIAENERLQAENAQLRAHLGLLDRYDALLDRYHALKLQGASEPQPARPIDQPVPDPIQAAIAAACRGDRRLHTLMATEAQRMRARGDHDIDILNAIQHGIESSEGLPA